MICPGVAQDCDNPGCRHGGCQGRPPQRPRSAIAMPVSDVLARNRPEQTQAPIAFEARRPVSCGARPPLPPNKLPHDRPKAPGPSMPLYR
jgi:hypothetical protein